MISRILYGCYRCAPSRGGLCLWIWAFLILITIQSLRAQIPQTVSPFESTGPLPSEITRSVQEAYEEMLSRQTDFSDEQAEFHVQNAYQVHQLLSSGKVLFNDEATLYVNMVANQILRDRPVLRGSLRFFAVRSPDINAFATNDGLVLVNIGLLAHVEEEAQLAFILCHEISHYLHQHPLDIYLNGLETAYSTPTAGIPGEQETGLSTRYTREKELEADRLGWELFLEAGYDPAAGLRAFELVSKAGSAFGEEPFDPDWLRVASVPFPELYQLDSLESPSVNQTEIRPATHPDPENRRQILEDFIRLQEPQPGVTAWVHQVDLENLRLRSQYEVVRLQILNRSYEQALYHIFCLQRQHGEDPELEKWKAVALYSLASYANDGKFWDVHEDYLFVPGEQQRMNFLIEQLSPEELTAIALHHVWPIHREYPEDQTLRMMSRELMESLGDQYLAKLDQEEETIVVEQAIFFPAMLEMMQDSVFAADIGKIMIRNKQLQDLAQTPMMRPSSPETPPTLDLVGLRLGLEKVVWVDPFYQVIRYQDEQPLSLLESEEKETNFTGLISEFSDQMQVDFEMYSMHEFESEDIEAFRQMALLQSWIQERSRHGDLSLVSPIHHEIEMLAAELGTPYFVWVGCIVQEEKRKGKGIMTTAGILLPPLLPYSIWYLVTPKPQTLMYCIVYNATTGDYEVIYPHMIGMRDRPDVIRSATYDLLNQLSQE